MNIGKFSINNKYFIFSIVIAIIVFGIYAKSTIKAQMAPDTNAPMITVIAQYPGASADVVAKDIVEPLEAEFGTLDGISNIKSTSQDNVVSIQLEFNYGVNTDNAAIDVQNSCDRIRMDLPDSMLEPKVLKFSTSNKPIITVSLSSDSIGLREVRQLAEEKIGFDLRLVEGVASVNYLGGNTSEVQVKVDKNKLLEYGLTLDSISNALKQNNINMPGGKVTDRNKEILIRIEEDFDNENGIRKIRIPLADGNSIYLEDIAEVDLSTEEIESVYRYNNNESIAVMISKKSDANTVDVVEKIKDEVDVLKIKYPYMDFEIAQDDSVFTVQMVNNMMMSILFALLLTVIVIMLFVTKVRRSFVISLSIPLVYMTTLILMTAYDMKLDMVTLSALILSIGFVVDASIIVVENITTHHDSGKDIVSAAIDGTNEIAMPSIAGVTTTLIVFVPLLFVQGFVGEMFRPLSKTIIFAISASIIIALIIIPLLTIILNKYKFKRLDGIVSYGSKPFNKVMTKLQNFYIDILMLALRHKLIMFVGIIVLMLFSGIFLTKNGMEMLPKFDSGTTYVSVEMESGTTIQDTTKAVIAIENLLKKEKNVVSYDTQIGYEKGSNLLGDFGIMGSNQALITINLNTRKDRTETIWEFQEKLKMNISRIPGLQRYVVKEKGGTAVGNSSVPLDIRISGPNQQILFDSAVELEKEISSVKGTTNVYKSFNMNNLQLSIKMDSSRLEELGLTNTVVAQQIYNSVEGIKSTTMDIGDLENVNISVQYMNKYNQSTEDILDLYINTPLGIKVPLREIAIAEISETANIITRENLEYTIDILGYTQDRAFSHITNDIQEILANYQLPTGYSVVLAGEFEDMGDSVKDMASMLGLAIMLIYLLLVSQFKSFIHPITIMSVIPLIIIGIAPALAITNKYISMPVLLGIILLAGTVVNNSILLIQQIIQNQESGISLENSLVDAVKARYRPIMMTALSDVVGMIPLASQMALGSERFSPLAITVIGGITAATFLTMIVVPVIYATFNKFQNKTALEN